LRKRAIAQGDNRVTRQIPFLENVFFARLSFCEFVLQRKILPDNLLVTFLSRLKYFSFEDTLLKCLDQNEIDLEGIREEVDTFMFEVIRRKSQLKILMDIFRDTTQQLPP
jgi:hypothetical protein